MVRNLHPVGNHGHLRLSRRVHPPPQWRHQRNQRVHGGHRGTMQKKVTDFSVPNRDVTNKTLPGRDLLNYSRPGRV
jgi:hypothetical protein